MIHRLPTSPVPRLPFICNGRASPRLWQMNSVKVPPVVLPPAVLPPAVEAVVPESSVAGGMDWLKFLKAGNARFQLTAAGTTYTYTMKAAKTRYKRAECHFFVDLVLTYARTVDMGRIRADDAFNRAGLRGQAAKPAHDIFAAWWIELTQCRPTSGFEAKHLGTCGRCGRELEDPISVASGIGPDCWKSVFGTPRKAPKKAKLKAAAVNVEPIFAAPVAEQPLLAAEHELMQHFLFLGDLMAKYSAAKSQRQDADIEVLKPQIDAAHLVIAGIKPSISQLCTVARACIARATSDVGLLPLPSHMIAAAMQAAGIASSLARNLENLKQGEAA